MVRKTSILKEWVESANLLRRLNKLESDIAELKQWKNQFADPQIRENISELKYLSSEVGNALSELNAVKSDINNNLLPKLESARQKADLAVQNANEAYNWASEALVKARELFDAITRASDSLKADSEGLKASSNAMVSTLYSEMERIRDAFATFGAQVQEAGKLVELEIASLKKKFDDAYSRILVPLNAVKEYARRCRDDPIIYLPYNVFMTIYWGFLR